MRTSVVNLREFLTLDRDALIERLADTTLELSIVYDQIGFLRAEELTAKRETWMTMAQESTQTRDRLANYAAAAHTTELFQMEAQRTVLNLERDLILFLIKERDADSAASLD